MAQHCKHITVAQTLGQSLHPEYNNFMTTDKRNVSVVWAQLKAKSTPKRPDVTKAIATILVTDYSLETAQHPVSESTVPHHEAEVLKLLDPEHGTSSQAAQQAPAPQMLQSETDHLLQRFVIALKDGSASVRRKALSDIRVSARTARPWW